MYSNVGGTPAGVVAPNWVPVGTVTVVGWFGPGGVNTRSTSAVAATGPASSYPISRSRCRMLRRSTAVSRKASLASRSW